MYLLSLRFRLSLRRRLSGCLWQHSCKLLAACSLADYKTDKRGDRQNDVHGMPCFAHTGDDPDKTDDKAGDDAPHSGLGIHLLPEHTCHKCEEHGSGDARHKDGDELGQHGLLDGKGRNNGEEAVCKSNEARKGEFLFLGEALLFIHGIQQLTEDGSDREELTRQSADNDKRDRGEDECHQPRRAICVDCGRKGGRAVSIADEVHCNTSHTYESADKAAGQVEDSAECNALLCVCIILCDKRGLNCRLHGQKCNKAGQEPAHPCFSRHGEQREVAGVEILAQRGEAADALHYEDETDCHGKVHEEAADLADVVRTAYTGNNGVGDGEHKTDDACPGQRKSGDNSAEDGGDSEKLHRDVYKAHQQVSIGVDLADL